MRKCQDDTATSNEEREKIQADLTAKGEELERLSKEKEAEIQKINITR